MSDAMSATPVYQFCSFHRHDCASSLNGLTQKSLEEQ
jgi:hypothetical protein